MRNDFILSCLLDAISSVDNDEIERRAKADAEKATKDYEDRICKSETNETKIDSIFDNANGEERAAMMAMLMAAGDTLERAHKLIDVSLTGKPEMFTAINNVLEILALSTKSKYKLQVIKS